MTDYHCHAQCTYGANVLQQKPVTFFNVVINLTGITGIRSIHKVTYACIKLNQNIAHDTILVLLPSCEACKLDLLIYLHVVMNYNDNNINNYNLGLLANHSCKTNTIDHNKNS